MQLFSNKQDGGTQSHGRTSSGSCQVQEASLEEAAHPIPLTQQPCGKGQTRDSMESGRVGGTQQMLPGQDTMLGDAVILQCDDTHSVNNPTLTVT